MLRHASTSLFLLMSISSLPLHASSSTDAIRTSGDILMVAMPLATLSTAYVEGGNQRAFDFTYEFSSTIASVHVLKYWVDETRPSGGSGSFPSGHTASAFSAAAFVETNYGRGWGVPSYFLASYVGWTRIEAKKHWPHDVAAGAAIAIGVNKAFSRYRKENGKGFSAKIVNFDQNRIEFDVSWRW